MKRYMVVSSCIVGILYLLTVMMILFSPPGDNAVIDHVEHGTKLILAHYFLGFLGFFGIAVVMKSSSFLKAKYEFLDYTKILAIIGFGLLSINNLRQIGVDHDLAHQAIHHGAGYYDFTVFFWRGLVELSPQGWVDFGFVGLWLITLNYLFLKEKTIHFVHSVVGMVLGACFVITVLGNVISVSLLTQLGMGLGGTILAPIYFVWLGLALLKRQTAIS
ncbi:hypothetical protein HNQ94_001122 [Salirhabdus euzebyi]|uniref:DUF4386 domain-containing protein n=1 Tax=Salirhabdus euzebyi TaxID=394506 RepID=A0A841PYE7_9BACI|nr:hypothetical protein [Salirhabdus euzebyi]MBB6452676.1 hypothetical protein [Salirhabdus euzebyi]